ncbi:MAG: carbohydrate kinase [Ilumatobacteraceae bacterium]|nr:carbohydrate kinase [Ilumatobacteraceae bacterium]
MSGDLVIGVDCSTTAAKAVVWDQNGRAVSEGRMSFEAHQPKSGWGEQDARDWWNAVSTAITEAAERSLASERIAAISVTHQRETFVCLDKQDQPIRPAILWLDVRATEEVREYGSEEIHRLTGKPPNPNPTWYKLLWLAKHEPHVLDRVSHVVDVAAFIIKQLTNEWATSWASADPMGLLDLSKFDYDDGLLEKVGLGRNNVPRLAAPGEIVGHLTDKVADKLGLLRNLPVVAAAGDGQCAGLGCNVTKPGVGYLNLGTGFVSGSHAETYSHATAYRTMASAVPKRWVLESFIGGGTYNINWFVNRLSGIDAEGLGLGLSTEQLLNRAADGLPPGSEGLMCLPYWAGAMTPYWDGQARGAFVGLSGNHGKAHMYRAILEGLAMEQRLISDGIEASTGDRISEIRALGGGSYSRVWCQILADALRRPIHLVNEQESTALGAGMLAAAAAGIHSDINAAADAMSGVRDTYQPNEAKSVIYDDIFDVYKDIYPALKKTFGKLADLQP